MTTVSIQTQLLNSRQAADCLGFTRSTLDNSRYTGRLGGVMAPRYKKLGKVIRYERSALDAWLSQFKEQTNTSETAA